MPAATSRWSDNDMFGHLNNAVYLELFDTAINDWMQAETGIDESVAPTLGVVAETTCATSPRSPSPPPSTSGST